MDWVSELRQGFGRLLIPGAGAAVSFADREDTLGEVGREFNALAEELRRAVPQGLTREQAHTARNRLAGILAALHLLEAGSELTDDERERLRAALRDAQKLDAALRPDRR